MKVHVNTPIEDVISTAIGYDPVPVSIDGYPHITWTHRTANDRDQIVTKVSKALFDAKTDRAPKTLPEKYGTVIMAEMAYTQGLQRQVLTCAGRAPHHDDQIIWRHPSGGTVTPSSIRSFRIIYEPGQVETIDTPWGKPEDVILRSFDDAMREDIENGKVFVWGEWLVVTVEGCTCGTSGTSYGHEPGCGLEPIAKVVDLLNPVSRS